MKRLVMLLVVGLGVGFGVGAYSSTQPRIVEHQGCCSHHEGVCGCTGDGKHAKCCDGTLSPSCGCD
jgi:hypothetical protein